MFKFLTVLLLVLFSSQIFSSESSGMMRKFENMTGKSLSEMLADLPVESREWIIAYLSLDWKYTTGTYKLNQSNSTIFLPEGSYLLIGEEANKERKLYGFPDNPHLDAIVYDADLENIIFFENYQCGYLSLEDFDENFDTESLLKSLSKDLEEEYKDGELHVTGWIQEPVLNKNTNTVYWAIEIESAKGAVVHSVAIRLGRQSLERIAWVTNKASFGIFGWTWDVMLSHNFDPGYTYQDYKKGDNTCPAME